MKLLAVALLSLLSLEAFACIYTGRNQICRGDLVYPNNWDHDRGARVVSVNHRRRTVHIRSRQTNNTYETFPENLFISRGCLRRFCVGQDVYPRRWGGRQRAEVIGISDYYNMLLVLDRRSRRVHQFYTHEVNPRRRRGDGRRPGNGRGRGRGRDRGGRN